MGIYILIWCFCILKQSREALNWPQTKGHMISSDLTINHLSRLIDRNDDPLRWYGTQVRYQYSINDRTYLSDRLSFQKSDTRNPKEALRMMNKYRRHNEVNVYYDPENPGESVLEPGNTGGIFMPLLIGGLLALFGLSSFYGQSLIFNGGPDRYLLQGQIYQNQGKLEEAFWQYNQLIKTNPYFALGYSNRGSLYLQQENWDYAIADFNQAIEINPNDAFVYYTLANAYLGKKEYEKALVNMNKAMERGFNVKPEVLEEIKINL